MHLHSPYALKERIYSLNIAVIEFVYGLLSYVHFLTSNYMPTKTTNHRRRRGRRHHIVSSIWNGGKLEGETLMRSPKIWRRRFYSIANDKRIFTGIRLCFICLTTRYWCTTKTNFDSITFEGKSMHKFPLRLLVLLSCLIYSWQRAAMGISSLLHRKRKLAKRQNWHHCRRRCPISFVFILAKL